MQLNSPLWKLVPLAFVPVAIGAMITWGGDYFRSSNNSVKNILAITSISNLESKVGFEHEHIARQDSAVTEYHFRIKGPGIEVLEAHTSFLLPSGREFLVSSEFLYNTNRDSLVEEVTVYNLLNKKFKVRRLNFGRAVSEEVSDEEAEKILTHYSELFNTYKRNYNIDSLMSRYSGLNFIGMRVDP